MPQFTLLDLLLTVQAPCNNTWAWARVPAVARSGSVMVPPRMAGAALPSYTSHCLSLLSPSSLSLSWLGGKDLHYGESGLFSFRGVMGTRRVRT